MKIHTNLLGSGLTIIDALNREKHPYERIDHGVTLKTIERFASRSHLYGWNIQLEASERNNGRRAGNSGSYGAMDPSVDGYAATFDEWGWLLAALYEKDPNMVVGTVKHPTYRNVFDFTARTGMTYNPDLLIDEIETGGDPYPYIHGQAARTKKGFLVGRRGFGRTDIDAPWTTYHPRTADEVREYAHLGLIEKGN